MTANMARKSKRIKTATAAYEAAGQWRDVVHVINQFLASFSICI